MSTGAPAAPASRDSAAKFGGPCTVPQDDFVTVAEVLQLINEERQADGLRPLELDYTLTVAAEEFACEMLDQDFFDHRNPATGVGPGERLIEQGYVYYAMGENLAVGQASAEEVFDDWMASPRHRANILSPEWRKTGIAVRQGGTYGSYWVQEFADPLKLDD